MPFQKMWVFFTFSVQHDSASYYSPQLIWQATRPTSCLSHISTLTSYTIHTQAGIATSSTTTATSKVPQSPGWAEPTPASRPIIPSSQSSFAEFRKQALEKEERVCVASPQLDMAATF